MSMEVNTIEKHGTGMIIQRMTNDTVALACGVESLVNQSFTFINYVGVLAAIFLISPGAFTIKLISVIALILIQSKKVRLKTKTNVLIELKTIVILILSVRWCTATKISNF